MASGAEARSYISYTGIRHLLYQQVYLFYHLASTDDAGLKAEISKIHFSASVCVHAHTCAAFLVCIYEQSLKELSASGSAYMVLPSC